MANERTIAKHPRIIRVSIALGGSIAFFLLAIVSMIYRLIQAVYFPYFLKLPLPDLEAAIEIGFIAGLFVLWHSALLHLWQQIEHRRFFSETNEDAIHPNSLSSVAPVSQSITLRLKRTHIWFWAILSFLAFGLVFLRALFNLQGDFFLAFLPLMGFVVLLFLVIGSIVIGQSFRTRRIVEMTKNGVWTRWRKEWGGTGEGKGISWQDAHFFACYKLPSILDHETFIYELSGKSEVIFWYWLSKPQSPFTIWKPEIPTEEYHQQMQMLCTFVIEKTGLPLHNLG